MARSNSTPESAAGSAAAPFAELDAIERHWRDALSFVTGGETAAAANEIDAAAELLERLGTFEMQRARAGDGQVAELAERIARLGALHAELVNASRNAQSETGRELAAAHRNRKALTAYSGEEPARHECDATG